MARYPEFYVDKRTAEVDLYNRNLEKYVAQLNSILLATLSIDDFIDLSRFKKSPQISPFVPPYVGERGVAPRLENYLPSEPTGVQKHLPNVKKQYEEAVHNAAISYYKALEAYNRRIEAQQDTLRRAREEYELNKSLSIREVDAFNNDLDEYIKGVIHGNPTALIEYFSMVLRNSQYPEKFPKHSKIAFVPESKQLVIEYDLPNFDVIPEVASYKYVKSKDQITTAARSAAQRKSLYSSVISQITIRTIHEIFEADRFQYVETIIFSGYAASINKATGKNERNCLVTVRTTRNIFQELNLHHVDPIACLKFLNASISKSPDELVPVRPVLEFDMVDARFVEETDVLSTLDNRPNLMELSPSEFESLITNLFAKMGLETRLTQASRDGGVDCVAYDPRPIFGGKVVIQAKRYKHTVGVSAVRDLYGTLQNEGASKGILVTTSGYGKAAFDFAAGKPIELLSGSNLLYLLSEHAGIEAKIEAPENWKDPLLDVGGE